MRQQIGDYYSHAARVGFTALGNKKEVEVHLASEIANSFIHQNPIDFSAADIIPWPQASQALISCPSRLFVEDKGQDILLQVLASEHWASRDFKLHFFGDGPDEAYISNLAKHLGIAHKVEFCGKAEGMLPIWHKTHLVVLPSRSEGVPLVLVGAMAAGRPSVVTDVGGNAEWIRDNRDGFVARMSNVWAFSEALERAWENRHRWREMGEAARETCLAKRDPDPAGTLLALLRKAAEREGKAETLKS